MLSNDTFTLEQEEIFIGFEGVSIPGESTTVKITTPEGLVIIVSAMEFLRLLGEYGSIVRFVRKEKAGVD